MAAADPPGAKQMFSRIVTQHWMYDLTDGTDAETGTDGTANRASQTGDPEHADQAELAEHDDHVTVVIDPTLASDRSLSLLRVVGGPTVLAVTPDRARELSLTAGAAPDAADLAARIAHAGITLNDPDYVFYFSTDEARTLGDHPAPSDVQNSDSPHIDSPHSDSPHMDSPHSVTTRQLTADDQAAFAQFEADAPADDLDEAYVELDHWLVYGTFVEGRLAAASSMYPWGVTHLADVGVITLPEFRGRGLGTATVRAISARAFELGFEPQYRCQIDNTASVALAKTSGFTLFGEWKVILPTPVED